MHLRYPRVLYQVLNEGPDERAWSEGDDAAEEEETERAMREEEWGADYGDDLHGGKCCLGRDWREFLIWFQCQQILCRKMGDRDRTGGGQTG